MTIKTMGTATIKEVREFEVDPIKVLKDIKETICKVPADAYVKDGYVVTTKDVSYHGSPVYEDTKHLDVSPNQVEIIKCIETLSSLIYKEMK